MQHSAEHTHHYVEGCPQCAADDHNAGHPGRDVKRKDATLVSGIRHAIWAVIAIPLAIGFSNERSANYLFALIFAITGARSLLIAVARFTTLVKAARSRSPLKKA